MIYELHEVESSNIKMIGYDQNKNILKVVMKSSPNTLYAYNNVPLSVYEGMETTTSKGKYFINEIKGKYEYTKVLTS